MKLQKLLLQNPRLTNYYPNFFSTLIFRCEEGILFLCSVLYAWYITFILRKCVPIKLTVQNLPPSNAALLTRRPAMWRLICEYAAEAAATGR